MKCTIVILAINFICALSYGQVNKSSWFFEDDSYSWTVNLENEIFQIDTIVKAEGHIYVISFYEDSSYIRFNYLFANSIFQCCQADSINLETEYCMRNGIFDGRGIVVDSELHWRVIRDQNVEIVYNYSPSEKVDFFDKIFDFLLEKLKPK